MANHLSISDVVVPLHELASTATTGDHENYRWETINKTLKAFLPTVPLVTLPAKKPLYGTVSRVGMIRRFYNETVAFILDGRPRTMDINIWWGIVNDMTGYMNAFHEKHNVGTVHNVSAEYYFMMPKLNTAQFASQAVQDKDVDKRLLSYAHCDIVQMWMTRGNGMDDMFMTLSMLSKIYWCMENSSL